MLNVREVKVRGGFRLWLRFNDGAEGEVDLREHLTGPVFETSARPGHLCGRTSRSGDPHDCVAQWR